MSKIKLSILIPSTHTRYRFNSPMIDELFKQYEELSDYDRSRVEVIVVADTKSMILGVKRIRMYEMAQGEYAVQLDDDDMVSPNFINKILAALESSPDVVCYNNTMTVDGRRGLPADYSIHHEKNVNEPKRYLRLPDYKQAIKRSIILKNISEKDLAMWNGEDFKFGELISPHLKSEVKIDEALYEYRFSHKKSETYQYRATSRRPARPVTRSRMATRAKPQIEDEPVVDIVIISRTSNASQEAMTRNAILTAMRGAHHRTNFIVMEDQRSNASYEPFVTVKKQKTPFNYNRTMNEGAKLGKAEWIMFCNNDIIFRDGWLDPLLKAGHPIMSPVDRNNPRQRQKRVNEEGQENTEHLSGWAFMMKRSLWEKIGGLDDDVEFWCSDDAVIWQVHELGIKPMLVPKSVVNHLGGQTFTKLPEADDMRWRSVYIFDRKYKKHSKAVFANRPEYLEWQKNNQSEIKALNKMKFKRKYI